MTSFPISIPRRRRRPLRSTLGSVNSACSCPGSDHPGPAVTQGRGSPEIDIFEAEKDKINQTGQVASQSAQFAPFSHDYTYLNGTLDEWNIFDPTTTWPNTYHGSAVYVVFLLLRCLRGCVEQGFPCFRQQAISSLAKLPPDMFQGSPNKRLVTMGTFDLLFWYRCRLMCLWRIKALNIGRTPQIRAKATLHGWLTARRRIAWARRL
jgi:hypothetical protein